MTQTKASGVVDVALTPKTAGTHVVAVRLRGSTSGVAGDGGGIRRRCGRGAPARRSSAVRCSAGASASSARRPSPRAMRREPRHRVSRSDVRREPRRGVFRVGRERERCAANASASCVCETRTREPSRHRPRTRRRVLNITIDGDVAATQRYRVRVFAIARGQVGGGGRRRPDGRGGRDGRLRRDAARRVRERPRVGGDDVVARVVPDASSLRSG